MKDDAIVKAAEAAKRREEALRESAGDDDRFDRAKANSPELNKPRRTLEQAKRDIARSDRERS